MIAGQRRGELCAIRWRHVDLDNGVLHLEKAIGQRSGKKWEKDTKAHQDRRITLDPDTIELLREHKARALARTEALQLELATTPSSLPRPRRVHAPDPRLGHPALQQARQPPGNQDRTPQAPPLLRHRTDRRRRRHPNRRRPPRPRRRHHHPPRLHRLGLRIRPTRIRRPCLAHAYQTRDFRRITHCH